MKTIEIKEGCMIKIKIVPDDYEESEKDVVSRDLTTSDRKSIGYSDISKERWDSIFKSKEDLLTIVSQSRDDSCVEEDLTLKTNYFRR